MERPLINPTANSFNEPDLTELELLGDDGDIEEAEQPEVISPDQLALPLAGGREVVVGDVRERLRRREMWFEFFPQWRSPSTAFAIISSIIVSVTAFVLGLIYFSKVGERVPFIYQPTVSSWGLGADRSVLLIMPILAGCGQALIIFLNLDNFARNRRLADTLFTVLTAVNFLGLFTILQLYALITNNFTL